MKGSQFARAVALVALGLVAICGLYGGVSVADAAHMSQAEPIASAAGPPGVAMAAPVDGSSGAPSSPSEPSNAGANGSYTHVGPKSPGVDLPPGNGDIMPSTTIYYVF